MSSRHSHHHHHKAPAAATGGDSRQLLEVYTPGFAQVIHVPSSLVYHLPPRHLNITRFVLCANFSATGECSLGTNCKFVHADTSKLAPQEIHVNYAWRSLEAVTYRRAEAGHLVRVMEPNSRTQGTEIPSQRLLLTKATSNLGSGQHQSTPLAHCAHFYFSRTCHLGPRCSFVHAVYLDSTAADFQRAPVPHLRRQQMVGTPSQVDPFEVAETGSSALRTPCCGLLTPRCAESDYGTIDCCGQSTRSEDVTTPHDVSVVDSVSPSPISGRFRHDPYTFSSSLVCVAA